MVTKINSSTLDFADIIRTRREALKLSKSELARRAGCHRTTIIKAEHDPEGISFGTMLTIMYELGLELTLTQEMMKW